LTIDDMTIDDTGPASLRLSGEIDAHSAASLAHRLAEASAAKVLQLDLAEVGFIDSSGLRVLLAVHRDREGRGCRLELVDPSPVVRRLLELTALDRHLHLV
jgi:anti-sigma B factor antagonist